jgi:PAT family beta-lactamase induction signal transducer AmpG
MERLSLKRSLVLFGLLQCGSILAFWLLSHLGPRLGVLTGALAMENLCFGMGTSAFTTFIMLLCDRRFTATQYALITSLLAFTRGFLTAPAGLFPEHFGWSAYFLACALAAVPGLLLLSRFDRWGIEEEDKAPAL